MTRILIARHGETVWNTEYRMQGRQDSPLTDKGVRSALALGSSLSSSGIIPDMCLVSPMQRALNTSYLIRKASGLDYSIAIEPLLAEMDLGTWEGLRAPDAAKMFPEDFVKFRTRPHEFVPQGGVGETFFDVYDRAAKVIDKVKERYEGTVLLVSHMILVQAALCIKEDKDVSHLRENEPIEQAKIYVISED
ncbi:MAG: histidine phosphatase family protein [Saccharofermentans sp.]|nr:histidine phosphatase family protein [Saccharofermentans sp.]